MRRVDLVDRDVLFFEWLYKVNVLDKDLSMELLGMKSDSYFYERIRKLERFGLIETYRQDMYSSSVYYLTQKGLNEIIEPTIRTSAKGNQYLYRPKPYSFNVHQYRHELTVAKIIIDIVKVLGDKDLVYTDREQRISLRKESFVRKRDYESIADILIPSSDLHIEVELSIKSKDRMFKKMINKSNQKVLWVIPGDNKILYNRITEQDNEKFKIVFLEDIDNFDWNFLIDDEIKNVNKKIELINNRLKELNKSINESTLKLENLETEKDKFQSKEFELKETRSQYEKEINNFNILTTKRKKETILKDNEKALHDLLSNENWLKNTISSIEEEKKKLKGFKLHIRELEEDLKKQEDSLVRAKSRQIKKNVNE